MRFASLTKKKKIIIGVVGVLVAYLIALTIVGLTTAASVKAMIEQTVVHARAAYDGLKQQNLEIAKTELDATAASLTAAETKFLSASFLKYSPLYWHYGDGEHAFTAAQAGVSAGQTVIAAIEPYADVIGFKGQGSFVGGTTEDRIIKIIETIDKINPSLDEVAAKLDIINTEMSAINPRRYPYLKFQNQSVADLINSARVKISQADALLAELRPAISVLPQVMGLTEPQKYLVLFQKRI